MGLILVDTSLEICSGIALVFWGLYYYLTKYYDFWEKRGVSYRRAVFPYGSLKDLLLGKIHMREAYASVYWEFPGERFCGVVELRRPVLVIRDPDLIKRILIRDFNNFADRAMFDTNTNEAISQNLFVLDGERWRHMRHKLSPAFSSGKMKDMFLLMDKCSKQLKECLEKLTKKDGNINVKEILAKFTIDIIATCAFGLEMNCLKDDNIELYKIGSGILSPTKKQIRIQKLYALFPSLCQMLNIQRFTKKSKQMLYDMVSSTVKYREENDISRKDFLDILIKLKQNKNIIDEHEETNGDKITTKDVYTEGLTLNDMVAQAYAFFAAGLEAASSTVTFCLYELAKQQDLQERLRQEVAEVLQRHGGNITYQALQEMKYMDQVVNETLRMYGLSVLHRRCTQTYRIPDSDLVLEKGQKICIPVYAIHHDPQYYPDPYKFDPERFTPENIRKRHSFVYFPFGEGPRNCIGMRFGLMQVKIGITTFLSGFTVEVSPETPIPMNLDPSTFITQSDKPVVLKVSPI